MRLRFWHKHDWAYQLGMTALGNPVMLRFCLGCDDEHYSAGGKWRRI